MCAENRSCVTFFGVSPKNALASHGGPHPAPSNRSPVAHASHQRRHRPRQHDPARPRHALSPARWAWKPLVEHLRKPPGPEGPRASSPRLRLQRRPRRGDAQHRFVNVARAFPHEGLRELLETAAPETAPTSPAGPRSAKPWWPFIGARM